MKKNTIIAFIIGFVILAIIIGGVYYFKNQPAEDELEFEAEAITIEDIEAVNVPDLPEQEQQYLDNLKEELKNDLNNVDNLLNLAQYQKLAGDYAGGIKTLKYAYTLDQTRHVTMNNLVDLYYINQQYNEAEQWCFTLIENDILWKNSYTFLRDIYKFHKKEKYYESNEFPELVMQAYERAAIPKDKKFFLLVLINYYKDTDNAVKVIEYSQKYLEYDPENQAIKDLIDEYEKKLIDG